MIVVDGPAETKCHRSLGTLKKHKTGELRAMESACRPQISVYIDLSIRIDDGDVIRTTRAITPEAQM